MKATYFMGHETFEVRECPIPKAKPGTVVVKNYACGVCGTDVHIYHGEKGSAAVNPPVVLGHEYSGVVTEVGEGVKGLKIGDHVTIDPNIYCGECEYCRNGKKQMCRHMEAVGVTMNGGFEEYSIVPAAQALLLDPNVPLEYGAMSEPLACCLHGIDLIGIKPGQSVAISGGGTMGMIMTQLALHSGGTNITVIEPIAMKREMAKKLGAVHTIDPVNQDRKEEAMKITDGRGFDVVIEASGSWRACDGIEELVGKGGTLEFFAALYRHDYDYKLNLLNAFFKEIRIVGGVFQSPYAFPRSIALVNTLDLDPILEMDCVFTPEAFEDAFEAQMNGRTIKSLVQFTPDVE